MAFELPPLPYPKNALEPYTSARTLEFHHGKHHQTYVTTLNKLVEGSPMERQSLEELIKATYKDESKIAVFNNAAQVWNHTFFWNCMKPNAGGAPKGDIAQAIERDLGGIAKFDDEFKKAATGQFGSGWAWLVADKGKLKVTHTQNGVEPL
ncbi:MAG TPA: superoxide dismutase, partial [Stellaceae bacterium]